MSSRQTWERRALAGVVEHLDEQGINIIEGLSENAETGEMVFAHEVLSEVEAQRVRDVVADVKARQEQRYRRLGGDRDDEQAESVAAEDDTAEDAAEALEEALDAQVEEPRDAAEDLAADADDADEAEAESDVPAVLDTAV